MAMKPFKNKNLQRRLAFIFSNIVYPLSLLIGVLLVPLSILRAADPQTKPFPAELDAAESVSAKSSITTPEYVVIRSTDETTFSSETSGKVIDLSIKEGSSFKKDEILLQLDCRMQAADLKKAEAQQAATSKALESATKLKSYGSISDFELVKAKSEADGADADVDKLSVIVEKCTIRAPFNGGVAEIMTHLYETVKQGDPLIKVVNTDNLTFELQVPSQWLEWLHLGSIINVHINDINRTITAKVSLINPEIEPISQTVKIKGLISPPEPLLMPGMTGQAIFPNKPNP